jgi:dTDP-4-amino-4,6-dideoxygalactose transaminase
MAARTGTQRQCPQCHAENRARAAFYDRALADAGLVASGAVQVPAALYRGSGVPNFHTYHQYVIRARRRDELKEFLRERGVGTMIYYPLPLHLQKCFAGLGYKAGDFPRAERAAGEVLALPMYPELTEQQIGAVADAVKAAR